MSDETKPVAMEVDPAPTPAPAPAAAGTSSTAADVKPKLESAEASSSKRVQHVTPNQDTVVVEKLEGKSEDEVKAIKEKVVAQIKFYFSDSNLPFDKFLWTLSMENPSGWVPLSTVCSFKRMRGYTEEYGESWILSAIEEIEGGLDENDRVVVVEAGSSESGSGARIRRRRKLEKDATAWDRSVYVKGFQPGQTSHNSQLQVEEWFATESAGGLEAVKKIKESGGELVGNGKGGFEVNAVRFRREEDEVTKSKFGKFKGSVFAEFKHLSDVETFLKLEPKPRFHGEEVLAMTKEAYVQMKVKEKGLDQSSIQRTDKGSAKPQFTNNNNSGKKFNAFHEMERIKNNGGKLPEFITREQRGITGSSGSGGEKRKRDGEDGEGAEGKKVKKDEPVTINYNGKDILVDRRTGEIVNKAELTYPENALLKFTNVGEGGDWKVLKKDLIDAGFNNTFMNFPANQNWGYLCLPESVEDSYIAKLKEAKLVSGGQELEWNRVPTGDEERNFYALRASFQGKVKVKQLNDEEIQAGKDAMKNNNRGGDRERGGRGRGGRGGRGNNRGGGRGGRGGRGGGRDRDGGDRRNGGNKKDGMDVDSSAGGRDGPPVVRATDA